jgi:predicted Zn-dependent protease
MNPRSLFRQDAPEGVPLSSEEASAMGARILGFASAPTVVVSIESEATGSTVWSRNQVENASDTQLTQVSATATYGRRSAIVSTSRIDDAGLRAAVDRAEAMAQAEHLTAGEEPAPPGAPSPVNPELWHENAQANLEPDHRIAVLREAIAAVEGAGLVGGGVVGVSARSTTVLTHAGYFEYARTSTSSHCVSARTPDGTGSGWAGWKGEDWAKADPHAMAATAIDLARRSRHPSAVEPGRYTVVMTPVAFGGLVAAIAGWSALEGRAADEGRSPFSAPKGRSPIGRKVFDERVTLSADPMDPVGGFVPFAQAGAEIQQFRPATWVRGGVVENLAYRGSYARARHRPSLENSGALRMQGGNTSIEEMIAATDRGLYVTRFSDVSLLSFRSFLMTGVTRDGTFLIEHGKITRPVKNLRFEDSPFFMLANLEAIGPAERVWTGHPQPAVMPSATVRDFSFTSVTDAV